MRISEWSSDVCSADLATTRKGPKRTAAGRSRISVRKPADFCWSRHQTMVWFSETAMASAPAVRSDLLHLSWRGSCRKLGMNCHPEPRLGIKEVDDGIWLVTFMQYDLGYIDLEQKPCNPSTTRSARGCHSCLRYSPLPMSPGRTTAALAVPARNSDVSGQ